MNTNSFTFHPWKAVQNKTYGDWEVWSETQPICGVSKEHEKENARLIAASPELLEACKYVVKYHREHDSGEGELFGLDFVTSCIAAIRVAEQEY